MPRSEGPGSSKTPQEKFVSNSEFSWDHLAANCHIHLRRGCQVRADKIYVIQFGGAVFALGIQEIEQRGAAVLVGKVNCVAHVHRLLKVLAFVWLQEFDVADQRGV